MVDQGVHFIRNPDFLTWVIGGLGPIIIFLAVKLFHSWKKMAIDYDTAQKTKWEKLEKDLKEKDVRFEAWKKEKEEELELRFKKIDGRFESSEVDKDIITNKIISFKKDFELVGARFERGNESFDSIKVDIINLDEQVNKCEKDILELQINARNLKTEHDKNHK